MDLGLDPQALNMCVQCGLCLPHCPTFRVSGDESMSPRGRIKLMREVDHHDAPVSTEVMYSFESCVQCRGCEPACPSEVPFGELMSTTRERLESQTKSRFRLRLMLWPLKRPRLLRAITSVLALLSRARVLPKSVPLPPDLPVLPKRLVASGHEVYMFTGCVMDAWQRDVHRATQRVLEAAGFGVAPTGAMAPCCGALHHHGGLGEEARELAVSVMMKLKGNQPIVVNSAGCGAALKDYGTLLGTPEAVEFSERVHDVFEFLEPHLAVLEDLDRPQISARVAIQDPCHLRHVQNVHAATRVVLRPFVAELVELDDQGLCCGAGGSYSWMHRDMADEIAARKVRSVERCAPDLVASANPGCMLHLSNHGLVAVHPIVLVDRALQSGVVIDAIDG